MLQAQAAGCLNTEVGAERLAGPRANNCNRTEQQKLVLWKTEQMTFAFMSSMQIHPFYSTFFVFVFFAID